MPYLHANLPGMLPERPRALHPESTPEFAATIPPSETARALPPVDHHCQLCPTCSRRLTGHRCKLVCAQCGYYLSCADYY
jgi:hypothetical protein